MRHLCCLILGLTSLAPTLTLLSIGCHVVAPYRPGSGPASVGLGDGDLGQRADGATPTGDGRGSVDVPSVAVDDAALGDAALGDATSTVDSGVAPDAPPATACPGGWCTIKAGSFLMGSPAAELCRDAAEAQHKVTLNYDFVIAQHEVTHDAYHQAVNGTVPADPCGPNCPVRDVSWHEAADYCNRLSSGTGHPPCYTCTSDSAGSVSCTQSGADITKCLGYRLPTEAEWEYAARAGTTTALYSGAVSLCGGDDPAASQIGWHFRNSGNAAHPIEQKPASPSGLYDIAGNVREWVNDWWADHSSAAALDPTGPATGQLKVVKGGSYRDFPSLLRHAARVSVSPTFQRPYTGFRCARRFTAP